MPKATTALVVTTINPPNRAMQMFADGVKENDWVFYVAGDLKSPDDSYQQFDAEYLSAATQREMGLPLASLIQDNTYARKNMAYLAAMRDGVDCIVETDDDNLPRPCFFDERNRQMDQRLINGGDWVNTYRYWTDQTAWPRGFPLDLIHKPLPEPQALAPAAALLQQGLADEDPDVDAIFRLVCELPLVFDKRDPIGLVGGSWCPFNSQNTTWFSEVFPLLYLPTHCSFRMIDIWRSLVAVVILSVNDIPLVFHDATVWQERNDHDLMKDFESEVSGYLQNKMIVEYLTSLELPKGLENLSAAMRLCYQKLVHHEIFPEEELEILEAWLESIEVIQKV